MVTDTVFRDHLVSMVRLPTEHDSKHQELGFYGHWVPIFIMIQFGCVSLGCHGCGKSSFVCDITSLVSVESHPVVLTGGYNFPRHVKGPHPLK
jgi:hypothetical protein